MTNPVGADLTDLDNFANGFPHAIFDRHRREAPVFWHEPTPNTPDGEGFWSVAAYAETVQVLRDAETYSSETGGSRPYGGTLLQDLPIAGKVLNMMDDPRHLRIRRLVSAGLTPRMIRRVEDDLRARAGRLLDSIDSGAEIEFVGAIAAELPMQMICLLLGVPEEERHWLFDAVEQNFDYKGSRKSFEADTDAAALRQRMFNYGTELIAHKRAHPGDDMLSIVANAQMDDVDPPTLDALELYMFFSLMFSAGAETTRNALAGFLMLLAEQPDDYATLRADPTKLAVAVEEVLRFTTPSPSKRRTAAVAAELGGYPIAPGNKVLVWEGSANRDEAVFADPHRFDIARQPNPHVAFGFGGHYCLGASLARLESRVLFEEMLPRFGSVDLVQSPEFTRSNRHSGLRNLHVRLHR